MNTRISRLGGILCLFMMLFLASSCNKDAGTTDKAPADSAAPSPQHPNVPAAKDVEPKPLGKLTGDSHKREGKYCFEFKEGNLSLRCELKLDAQENVQGVMHGIVTHPDNSKMPYEVKFSGSKLGSELTLKVIGDENGSTEERLETWQWAGANLQDLKHRLDEAACG